MPELPEVETILEGIRPYVENQCLKEIVVRQRQLRWKIPKELEQQFPHHKILALKRRGKYILFQTKNGTAILHFGMSGSLAILSDPMPPTKHDHFDLIFSDFYLRYTDPRKFGALLWTSGDPQSHPLLSHLGLEPLEKDFNGQYLFQRSRNRKTSIKQFIMNSSVVVGVGNIYAAESLFLAKIHPQKRADTLNIADCTRLANAIRKVLQAAIKQGGTTLRNFMDTSGKPGYFKQKLNVYGREEKPCVRCHTKLVMIRMQNRSTVFCPTCQAL